MPLLTIPPSKVRPQCKAIKQKLCKSCEHVFRAKRRSEHTPINYYWRMCYIYFRTRACVWYSRMRPIYKLQHCKHYTGHSPGQRSVGTHMYVRSVKLNWMYPTLNTTQFVTHPFPTQSSSLTVFPRRVQTFLTMRDTFYNHCSLISSLYMCYAIFGLLCINF